MSEAVGQESEVQEGYKKIQVGPELLRIPEEWNVTTIEDIALRFISGGTPDSDNEAYWGGEIPWTTCATVEGPYFNGQKDFITHEGLENSSATIVPAGGILFGTRVNVANIARTQKDIAISQDLTGIVLNEGEIDANYLIWYLLFNQRKIRNRYSQGSTIQGMITADVQSLPILVPPLPKQHRIADILSLVDEEIQQTAKIIGENKKLKEGLIQDLIFFGPDHQDTQTVQLGPMTTEIAASWETTTVGDVTETVQYGISESLLTEGMYPVFRMNNIEDGKMVSSPMKYTNLEPEKAKKYAVQKGDILFNRTNSIDLVGKSGIFDLDGDFVFASYLIRIQTTDKMNPYFLNYYLNSHTGQGILYSYATRGASQANINATSLKSVKVPLPPRKQQDKIVQQIQSVEEKISQERENKQKLKELKRGLMQDLLTGKVRVTPDSSEP